MAESDRYLTELSECNVDVFTSDSLELSFQKIDVDEYVR